MQIGISGSHTDILGSSQSEEHAFPDYRPGCVACLTWDHRMKTWFLDRAYYGTEIQYADAIWTISRQQIAWSI